MISGIFEIIGEILFEIACYLVGRIVVEAMTLGHVKCHAGSMGIPKDKLRLRGLYFRRGKRIYLTEIAVRGIGMISLTLLLAGAWLMHELTS